MKPSSQKEVIIFTDGASLGNPGPGGYGAVIVFQALDELIELGGSKGSTTNNEMELSAVVAALSYVAHNTTPVHIYTDSAYVINGITKWIYGWEKNGWITKTKEAVSHERLWKDLVQLVRARGSAGIVSWHKVSGHSGMPGNERADSIATGYGKGEFPQLYRGRLSEYGHDVLHFEYNQEAAEKKSRSKAEAYSYLSLVDGVAMRHTTWKQCEARVKGKSAKFKKAISHEDELAIITSWDMTSEQIIDDQS